MWNSRHEGLWILDEGLDFERGSCNMRGPKARMFLSHLLCQLHKSQRARNSLSLGVLPWIPREEGPTDRTLTATDFRAGRKEGHLKQTEDPNWIHFAFQTPALPPPTCWKQLQPLERWALQKPFRAVLEFGCWGSAQQIHLSYLMLRVSAIFFLLEHLSLPDGKILILMKTEKQFKKTRNRKKMRPSYQVERKSTHFP